MLFDVWHQYRPVKFLERSLGEDGKTMDFYAPAVFQRGQVEALDGAHAIAVAKQLGMSRSPMVRESMKGVSNG